jgi:hypothetical protein
MIFTLQAGCLFNKIYTLFLLVQDEIKQVSFATTKRLSHGHNLGLRGVNLLNRETYFFVPPSVTSGETVDCFAAYCQKGQWSKGLLLRSKRIPGSNLESSQQLPKYI